MPKKPALQADKTVAAPQALMTPQMFPDTAALTRPAGKRVDATLDPKDDALQEDLAALLGDDIGAGQAERVLLAQAQPGVPSDTDKGAGAGSTDAGAGAGATTAGAGAAATFPTALVVLGGLGLAAAAAGGGGGGSSAAAAPAGPDTTAPTVAITDNVTAATTNGPVTFTFTFSEPVTGFDTTDIVVAGGTKGAFTTVSSSVYTLVVTPTAGVQAGTITVNVAAGVAIDAASNPNTAAVQATQSYDTVAPTVTITDNVAATANGPVTFTFTFSENVTGFTAADVAVTGGTAGAFNALSGSVYILEVIPTANTLAGTITVNVVAAAAVDTAGNASTAAVQATQAYDTQTPDTTAPTVTITDNVTAATTNGPVTYTFAFSENVTGFDTNDVVVTGGTKGAFTAVSPSFYTLVVTPTANTQAGAITVNVAAGVAFDAAAIPNGNVVATQATQAYDTAAPTVSSVAITSATGIQGSLLNAGDVVSTTVTMSEAATVTGTPQLALNIGGTTVQAGYASGSGTTALVFNYTILAGQTDANGISIAANSLALNGGTITDTVGNAATLAHSLVADNSGFQVDTTAPAVALTAATDDVGTVTGALASGATTDDTALLLSGTNEAGATVQVFNGATLLGTATALTATTWSFTATVADGTTYQFNAKATDAAGNTSTATANFTVIGDTTAPTAPVISVVAGDNIINAAEAGSAITGTAEANATVNLTVGAGNVRTVTANGAGAWTYTLVAADITAMDQGAETLSATATDAAGNVSGAGTRAISIDTVVPAAPVISVVAGDNIINAAEAGSAITGTAEVNATVNLTLGAGNVRTVTADGAGAWTYTLVAADITAMDQGAETLSATATDAAGNVSGAGTRAISIDTVVPTATAAITAVTDDVAPVTGNLTTGGATNDTSLALSGTITGTLNAGEVVAVYDGATRLGNATVSGATWTYTDITLADGNAVSYTVRVEDAAGNQGTASAAFTTTIDTTAPTATAAITAVTDDFGLNIGNVPNGGATDDTSLDLSGTITGTLGAGELVAVYDGATKLGNATVSGATWTYTDSTLANGDAVSYTVRVEDAAGNQGTASDARTANISAPTATAAITAVADDVPPVTGNLTTGGATNDTSLALSGTITGTLNAGEVVAVYDGATKLGNATVEGGGTTWTYTDSTLANGNAVSYTVRVENSAGDQGTASTAFTTTIDTLAPTAPAAPTVAENAAGGINAAEAADGTPVVVDLTGTGALAGDTLTVNWGGQTVNYTLLASDISGNSATVTVPAGTITTQGQGTFNVSALITDVAGNVGATSATTAVTVDTIAPTLAIAATLVGDNIANAAEDNTVVVSGTSTGAVGLTVNVALTDSVTTVNTTAVVAGDGTWSATAADISALINGNISITANTTDAAGNAATQATKTIVLDNLAPTLAIAATLVGDNVANAAEDNTVVVSGTTNAEDGRTVAVTLSDGTTTVNTSATVAAGAWTATAADISALINGNISITANTTDAAGNAATQATKTIVLDNLAPTLAIAATLVGDNVANAAEDNTVVVSGTTNAEDGRTVAVTLSDGTTTVNTSATVAAGAWTAAAADISALINGNISITANTTDAAGNAATQATKTIVLDNLAPTSAGANFTETVSLTESINLVFNEAVTASNTNGLTLHKNPDLNDGQGGWSSPIVITPTGVSGLGSTTITIATNTDLISTDVVRAYYDATFGNLTDLAGNAVSSGENWIGGSGANIIDLSNYGSNLPITLRGNGGADQLTGNNEGNFLIDGGGPDTLTGGRGRDIIRLVENGTSVAYFKDTVIIGLGESTVYDEDEIRGNAISPAGTGFNISGTTTNDVLSLQSNVIAANVTNANGTDVNALATHSIANGIVTFQNSSNGPILINTNNVDDAIAYLGLNITTPGTTVAFRLDIDNSGVIVDGVDALYVFQDNGTIPLSGGYVVPDTGVALIGLIGLTSATLGTAAVANVVQLVDTTPPEPIGFALTTDGFAINTAENAFATIALAMSMQKFNGVSLDPAISNPTSVDGSGTTSLAAHYSGLSLLPTDWALMSFAGTNPTNSIRDAANNFLSGSDTWAEGGSGNNTIDLSGLGSAGYGLSGNAGNDTLIGSGGDDWLDGGIGADTMTGGFGSDDFDFEQGDSPAVTAMNLGGGIAGVLDNGDTYTFAGGVDRITDFDGGEGFNLNVPNQEFANSPGGVGWMGAQGQTPATAVLPTDGLATNQGFFLVQGAYNTGTTTFTVNSSAGTDTLVVWDGDSTGGVLQTGIVLSGVTLADLNAYTGNNWIQHI